MSFLNSFAENVRNYPDKTAIEFIDPPLQRVSYAELAELVSRTTSYLQSLELRPGDRVALQLSKCLEFILLHLATIRLGCITLPLNLAYPPDELKYFLEDSSAKLFFALESNKVKVQSILPDLPDLQQCIFLNPTESDKFISLITGYPRHGPETLLDQQPDDNTAVIIYTAAQRDAPKVRRSRTAIWNPISKHSMKSGAGSLMTCYCMSCRSSMSTDCLSRCTVHCMRALPRC